MWPTPSRISRRACGISRASRRPLTTGSIRSSVPCTISVGTATFGSRAAVLCPATACICIMITATATGRALAMARNDSQCPGSAAKASDTFGGVARAQRALAVARHHRGAQALYERRLGQLRLGAARERAPERQRAHALGVAEHELLGHHPAHRDPHHVGALPAGGVEQA